MFVPQGLARGSDTRLSLYPSQPLGFDISNSRMKTTLSQQAWSLHACTNTFIPHKNAFLKGALSVFNTQFNLYLTPILCKKSKQCSEKYSSYSHQETQFSVYLNIQVKLYNLVITMAKLTKVSNMFNQLVLSMSCCLATNQTGYLHAPKQMYVCHIHIRLLLLCAACCCFGLEY